MKEREIYFKKLRGTKGKKKREEREGSGVEEEIGEGSELQNKDK